MNYYEYTKYGVVVAAVQLRHNTWSDMCNLLYDGEPFEMLTWKIDTGTSLLGSGFDLVYPNV